MYDLNSMDIRPSIRSDHSMIGLEFYNKDEVAKRGPSFWHFNASLLKDKVYTDQIKVGFQNALDKYADIDEIINHMLFEN